MKVGDSFSVRLDEHEVAQATIEHIEDGQAVLVIPATRIVMGVRTSLSAPPERVPEVDRVFGGIGEDTTSEPSEAQREVNEGVAPAVTAVPEPNPQMRDNSRTVLAPDDVGNGLGGAVLDSSILD